LLRRSRPGTEQEFDKADFDSFCSDRGREPYSIKWFMICFKKLLDTRLVKLVRKYCVYGFKVVVFHPWQLDDWVLNDKPRNTSYRNKTSTNSNKTSKKQTSNVDSAVPSYRGSRENKENTAIGNGSTESCATSKIQDFIAAKKKKFQHPRVTKEKTVTPQISRIKPAKPIIRSIPQEDQLSAKNEDFKEKSGQNYSSDPKDKLYRSADVEVFSNFLNKLNDLGIQINQTVERYLVKYIKTGRKGIIETALGLFRSRKRDQVIAEPAAYFIQLLKTDIGKEKAVYSVNNDIDNQDTRCDFNHWLELAKEVGCCSGHEMIDGKIIVNMNGVKESWESVFNRGYNFEYFKGILKK